MNITEKTGSPGLVFAAFACIYFIWGSTYLAIRFAMITMPPFLMAGFRFLIAGFILFVWSFYRNKCLPDRVDWKSSSISGILMVVGGNGIVVWTQQFVPSGFAAVMVATMPIWIVIMNWMSFDRNRPDNRTFVGIAIGLGGVALISGIDKNILISTDLSYSSVVLGAIMLSFASGSWSLGSLISRHSKSTLPVLYFISLQMLVGGTVLTAIGLLYGELSLFSFRAISALSIVSFVYLVTFGSIVAYAAYVWLLKVSTPSKVGTYAFFNPLVAVILGWLFANEPINMQIILGAGAILSSVLMINQSKNGTKLFKLNIKDNIKKSSSTFVKIKVFALTKLLNK